jgi:hypothetical protein
MHSMVLLCKYSFDGLTHKSCSLAIEVHFILRHMSLLTKGGWASAEGHTPPVSPSVEAPPPPPDISRARPGIRPGENPKS